MFYVDSGQHICKLAATQNSGPVLNKDDRGASTVPETAAFAVMAAQTSAEVVETLERVATLGAGSHTRLVLSGSSRLGGACHQLGLDGGDELCCGVSDGLDEGLGSFGGGPLGTDHSNRFGSGHVGGGENNPLKGEGQRPNRM